MHSASSAEGFECVLMMEGESAADGSDRVSRVVRPDEEAGRHARPGASDPIGPRGYVRRKEGRFMVWRDHDDTVTRLAGPGVPGLRSKVLSSNATAPGVSVLVDLPAGWARPVPAAPHERFLILTEGGVTADGTTLEPCSLINIPAGLDGPAITAGDGARLLVKVSAAP